ncbi:MAG: AAA family ATPase, partial [Candidatus Heimdallarchaeota archaeon]|nr:AAA family ATPase [Candidatus Heimdallarchaeota archaeon]
MNRQRFEKILQTLNEDLYERKDHIYKAFLAFMTGESVFFLGPPGVAKSLIARRLKFAFRDAKSFEYLMNRFSTPEEIFGPISIAKLRDEDKLERKIEHYLPGANVAFLDEIWKAGPSIQNTLLTIINEKIYRNGDQEIKVPLYGVIAASNELPAKGQGLEALWDRFIVRQLVENIENKDSFATMIKNTSNIFKDKVDKNLKISIEEYQEWLSNINKVKVPDEIIQLIHHVKYLLQQYNFEQDENPENRIYVSDRRWKKIVKVLKTSSSINGRDYIDLMDCFLIIDMIWDNPNQITTVERMIRDAISQFGYSVNIDKNKINTVINKLEKEINVEIFIISTQNVPKYDYIESKSDYYYKVTIDWTDQKNIR